MTALDRQSLSLRLVGGQIEVLDQTLLPFEEKWISIVDYKQMIAEIQRLAVRGAPLIGVAATLSFAIEAEKICFKSYDRDLMLKIWNELRDSRPTAVNLMNAMDRMKKVIDNKMLLPGKFLNEALAIFDEDVELCKALATQAAALIDDHDGVLTHCNTGGLATAGDGTALAGIKLAHDSGKKIHVYVDETRPLGQGSRLTTWELEKAQIPYTLICDNMAGFLMAQGKIQKIFVGADRIAVNGDAANKIGTYSVAVLAAYHKIPFYVVAPSTSLDPDCATGANIPIEERNANEVRGHWAKPQTPVWNPAFDVTPKSLITAIILENKIWK